MPAKKARRLRNILLVTGGVVMLLAYIWEPFFTIGAVVAVSSIIPQFLFNKCPHCGKNLGRSEGDYCPFCGKRIDN